jgi:hypothetical protein
MGLAAVFGKSANEHHPMRTEGCQKVLRRSIQLKQT